MAAVLLLELHAKYDDPVAGLDPRRPGPRACGARPARCRRRGDHPPGRSEPVAARRPKYARSACAQVSAALLRRGLTSTLCQPALQKGRERLTCLPRQETARWLSRGRGKRARRVCGRCWEHYSCVSLEPYLLEHIRHRHSLIVLRPLASVRYEDPGAVEGLAGALDARSQVTGGVCAFAV